jgi:hypothetical protein
LEGAGGVIEVEMTTKNTTSQTRRSGASTDDSGSSASPTASPRPNGPDGSSNVMAPVLDLTVVFGAPRSGSRDADGSGFTNVNPMGLPGPLKLLAAAHGSGSSSSSSSSPMGGAGDGEATVVPPSVVHTTTAAVENDSAWIRLEDGEGRPYYHHASSGQTQWEPPAGNRGTLM